MACGASGSCRSWYRQVWGNEGPWRPWGPPTDTQAGTLLWDGIQS